MATISDPSTIRSSGVTEQAMRRVLAVANSGVLPLVKSVTDDGWRVVVQVRCETDLDAWALHADCLGIPRPTETRLNAATNRFIRRTWFDLTWRECPVRVMFEEAAARGCMRCGGSVPGDAPTHGDCSPRVVTR